MTSLDDMMSLEDGPCFFGQCAAPLENLISLEDGLPVFKTESVSTDEGRSSSPASVFTATRSELQEFDPCTSDHLMACYEDRVLLLDDLEAQLTAAWRESPAVHMVPAADVEWGPLQHGPDEVQAHVCCMEAKAEESQLQVMSLAAALADLSTDLGARMDRQESDSMWQGAQVASQLSHSIQEEVTARAEVVHRIARTELHQDIENMRTEFKEVTAAAEVAHRITSTELWHELDKVCADVQTRRFSTDDRTTAAIPAAVAELMRPVKDSISELTGRLNELSCKLQEIQEAQVSESVALREHLLNVHAHQSRVERALSDMRSHVGRTVNMQGLIRPARCNSENAALNDEGWSADRDGESCREHSGSAGKNADYVLKVCSGAEMRRLSIMLPAGVKSEEAVEAIYATVSKGYSGQAAALKYRDEEGGLSELTAETVTDFLQQSKSGLLRLWF